MATKTRFPATFLRFLQRPLSQRISVPIPMGLIYGIGVDIDQCLTTTGEPQTRIWQQARAMAKLQKYNEECRRDPQLPKMFLVSGRDVRYGQAIANILGVHDWCVAEYGGILYHPITGEIVENKAIDSQKYLAFQDVRKIAEKLPEKIPALRLYHGKSLMVTLERIPGAHVSMKILLEMVRSEIEDFEKQGTITILASQIAVDILPGGIDKGRGLRYRHESELTTINPARILYIDDSMGGSAAAKVAGFTACPSNASPEYKECVRAQGGYVAKLPLREGVVESMRHYKIKI